MSLISRDNETATPYGGPVRNVKWAFDYRQPLLLIHLIYAIPSFIAYHKCRQFLSKNMKNSYFNVIFANDFFINVFLFLIDFLFTRLPISGLFEKLPDYVPGGVFIIIVFFLSYYLIYANFCSITLICLNRMSAVVFPYSCNSFWQRFVKISIASVYILPLAVTWQMFTYQPYFLPLYDQRSSFQLVYRQTFFSDFLLRNSTALCFSSIFLSVICVFANSVTIIKYKISISGNMGSQTVFQRKKSRKTEYAMMGIALVVCLSLVIQAILQALIMLYSDSPLGIRGICQDLRAYALDIAICGPPWILYYTTVFSHRNAISTSSMHSNAIQN